MFFIKSTNFNSLDLKIRYVMKRNDFYIPCTFSKCLYFKCWIIISVRPFYNVFFFFFLLWWVIVDFKEGVHFKRNEYIGLTSNDLSTGPFMKSVLFCKDGGGPSSIWGVGDPWDITEEVMMGGFDTEVITSELTGFHCILNSKWRQKFMFKMFNLYNSWNFIIGSLLICIMWWLPKYNVSISWSLLTFHS